MHANVYSWTQIIYVVQMSSSDDPAHCQPGNDTSLVHEVMMLKV